MPVLIENKVDFTEEEDRFLAFVASDKFPWYLSMATPNFPTMSHNLLLRTDMPEEGTPHSEHYYPAREIFDRICRDNNIVVRTVYRMAFNLTFSDPSLHGDPHIDHAGWPHKNMLIYLNKFDAGDTWLFDDQRNVEARIKAEVDKFVVFDGGMHANGFCKPQQTRMVFVATFDGDVMPAEKLEAAE